MSPVLNFCGSTSHAYVSISICGRERVGLVNLERLLDGGACRLEEVDVLKEDRDVEMDPPLAGDRMFLPSGQRRGQIKILR